MVGAQLAAPAKFRLYLPDLDNHVLIETSADGVVISATRDNFTNQRKKFFIRQLAAEGYIPDRYEWFSEPAEDGFFGVKWMAGVAPAERQPWLRKLRKWCLHRNFRYGCLAVMWLIFFAWAVRHTSHSSGL